MRREKKYTERKKEIMRETTTNSKKQNCLSISSIRYVKIPILGMNIEQFLSLFCTKKTAYMYSVYGKCIGIEEYLCDRLIQVCACACVCVYEFVYNIVNHHIYEKRYKFDASIFISISEEYKKKDSKKQ